MVGRIVGKILLRRLEDWFYQSMEDGSGMVCRAVTSFVCRMVRKRYCLVEGVFSELLRGRFEG
jgi:hypothetical protein